MNRCIKISEICKTFGLTYEGNDIEIDGLNLCNRPSQYSKILTYVTSGEYVDIIKNNSAVAAIVLDKKNYFQYVMSLGEKYTYIVCKCPEKIFYDIHDYLYYQKHFYEKYNFVKEIGSDCSIEEGAIIEDGVKIGNRVVIGHNTVIKRGTTISDDCVIGCNTTIGSEGFQVFRIGGVNRRVKHCGGVFIDKDVSIGDNTDVCNSLFEGNTHIGKNTKIDNLVHVGHNVFIGDNAVITAGTILCGSCVVENQAWIGVNTSILNRVVVGENSKVGMGSVVTHNVPAATLVYGVPARIKDHNTM